MPKARILIIDDEEDIRESLGNIISRKINCSIEKAATGEEALKKLKEDKFDLALVDIKMPGLSGIDVIQEAKKFSPQTKFLAISGYDSNDIASSALENIANNAKSMNANAVIKTKLHIEGSLYYYDGEAVAFDVMPKE